MILYSVLVLEFLLLTFIQVVCHWFSCVKHSINYGIIVLNKLFMCVMYYHTGYECILLRQLPQIHLVWWLQHLALSACCCSTIVTFWENNWVLFHQVLKYEKCQRQFWNFQLLLFTTHYNIFFVKEPEVCVNRKCHLIVTLML